MADTEPPPGLHRPNGVGGRPDPDPTVLTAAAVALATDTLRRELKAAVEIIEAKINGQQATIETRLNGMDTAITLVREVADKLPARMDEKVSHLEDLTNVKFAGIQTQFAERDVRTEQSTIATKTAVDAALQAQKEAAGNQAETFSEATRKSEDQFTKQIDQQGELLRTATKGLEDKINDLKDRFNRGEGVGIGTGAAHTTQRADSNFIAYLVFGLIGAAGVATAIILAIAR
jgi:hypothetical protein